MRRSHAMSESDVSPSIGTNAPARDFYPRECAPPTLSVILPTFRRPLLLAAALESIGASRGCAAEDVEVIVVDNSPDLEARMVVTGFEARFPFVLHYAVEARPGVSNARNCGAALARGRLLVFMDDDQQIDPSYLERAPRALAETKSDCIGGWLGYLGADVFPAWIRELTSRMGTRDLGPEVRRIGEADPKLAGGNIAITKEAFTRIGGFRGDLAQIEDVDLQERLLAAGGAIFYDPALRQYHHLEPQRLKRSYYLARSFLAGRSECRTRAVSWKSAPRICGVPRFVLRKVAGKLAAAVAGMTASPAVRFNRWCEAAGQCGW